MAWQGALGVPAFSGAIIGHVDRQFTVPIGVRVEIDADAGTITMLESAVVQARTAARERARRSWTARREEAP